MKDYLGRLRGAEELPFEMDLRLRKRYITVIQKINALRMVCNLGLHYDSRHDLAAKEESANGSKDWSTNAQQAFDFQREMYSVQCSNCQAACGVMAKGI